MWINRSAASKTCRCIYHASGQTVSLAWRSLNNNQHPANCRPGQTSKSFPPVFCFFFLPHLTLLCSSHTYLWETEIHWLTPSLCCLFRAHGWVFALQLKQGQKNSGSSIAFSRLRSHAQICRRCLSSAPKCWVRFQTATQINHLLSSMSYQELKISHV